MPEFFNGQRLVAYWRPHGGLRHGLHPTEPPHPDEERDTLCGETIRIGRPTAIDWLSPTCEACWLMATATRDRLQPPPHRDNG